MAVPDQLEDAIRAFTERANAIEIDLQRLRDDAESTFKDVKQNIVLDAIHHLGKRLDAIEARLPEPEDE